MSQRRAFLGAMIGEATGVVMAGTRTVATRRVLESNERIRFGLIGGGSHGKEIFRAALRCPDVEAVAVADIYTRRLDEAMAIVPGIATFKQLPGAPGRQVDRRGPDRDAAAPARARLRRRDPGGQGRVSGEDHGVQSLARPPHEELRRGGFGTSGRMQVPDTFQVAISHPEKLLFTFTSMFGNDYYGEGHDYLFGTKATLVHTQSDQVRVVPQGAKSAAGPGPEDGGYSRNSPIGTCATLRLRPQPQRAGLPVRARLSHRDLWWIGAGTCPGRRSFPPRSSSSAWRSFPSSSFSPRRGCRRSLRRTARTSSQPLRNRSIDGTGAMCLARFSSRPRAWQVS